ncbi:MAG: AzlC family ABC transporter permease [Deltaproteobacteria bacterium]|nr:AzlC family ABC transporter permease [Deltaproteobacteria bacterium]
MARQIGVSLFETIFMSLIVYAGSSQILAIGLLQAGQPTPSIVLATFLFNLRFFLMSTSLAPHVAKWPWWMRTLFGYQVADESFALLSVKFSRGESHQNFAIAVHMTAYVAWSLFSLIGYLAGSLIPNINRWGLDFALPAVLIGLLFCLIQNRLMVVVAALAAGLALILSKYGLKEWAVMVPAVVAAVCGAGVEQWKKHHS